MKINTLKYKSLHEKMIRLTPVFFHALPLVLFLLIVTPVFAQEEVQTTPPCDISDNLCLMNELAALAPQIETQSWRDKVYRELAKSYTAQGLEDKAIALIPKVQTPDTQAMTIRGIGFEAARADWDTPKRYDALFATLLIEAEKIDHPPSHGIALTYISMAQSMAGRHEAARATAQSMTNPALRHKAHAENAEIQAEQGDVGAAMASISYIDDAAFKDKAYRLVSRILVQKGDRQAAYETAHFITNPYSKAQAYQFILEHESEKASDKTLE